MKIETRAQARAEIQEAILSPGPYSHNLISYALRLTASRFGYRAANRLIDEFNLTKLYGIQKRQEGNWKHPRLFTK